MPKRHPLAEGRGLPVVDSLIDTLLDFLRTVRDVPVTAAGAMHREQLDSWIQHLASGAVHPDNPEGYGLPLTERDWLGARTVWRTVRRKEAEQMQSSVGAMQDFALELICQLSKSMVVEDEQTEKLNALLLTLKSLVRTSDRNAAQNAINEVAGEINRLILARRRRRDEQIKYFHGAFDQVSTKLDYVQQRLSQDAVTDLYSRSAFDEKIAFLTELNVLFNRGSLLFMIDVDGFKNINDTFGHVAGDEIIRRLATELMRIFARKSDFVARYGGDEFAVIIPEGNPDVVGTIAKRILDAIRKLPMKDVLDAHTHITVSIGAASLAPDETPGSWVDRADQALYKAKEQGRDCYVFGELGNDEPQ